MKGEGRGHWAQVNIAVNQSSAHVLVRVPPNHGIQTLKAHTIHSHSCTSYPDYPTLQMSSIADPCKCNSNPCS